MSNLVLFSTLVVLNVFDVVTTKLMMNRGGTEMNPLLGDDIVTIGLVKVAVLLAIWVLMRRVDKPWVTRFLFGTVVVYAFVVGVNTGGLVAA